MSPSRRGQLPQPKACLLARDRLVLVDGAHRLPSAEEAKNWGVGEGCAGAAQNRDDELEDVAWFTADALPPVPPGYSIARALIDDFARRRGVDPATVPTWQRAKPSNR